MTEQEEILSGEVERLKLYHDLAVEKTETIRTLEQQLSICKEGKRHLEFIYGRLKQKHGESENIDYMIRFKEIIDNIPNKE